ncbi:MAG: hypothetical protein A2087_14010 [Spirochaetes bacterium GWD1_61_31]|nr:MAG: hypothetical protein A2Y37_00320 [Spirochaetes bacterium GWB1_60_80]OHD28913.1 MAG: hypothetical protein A2004_10800 [Spirochaetes bacterium GWC1_61_12]OHD40530.1 MAG: hypothetical protein A2087_14010 [Spirochaetes bacterium GWD1_61_31]OHD43552.1 MAG: hypothetical protein A2Y35_04740 [Spirochaetes bacterium GWE1_60_18]OHD59019.1 MAG: hypothetical protein A2Y32_01935 [Spirochaetes bacterium GWF1_60_12]
MNVTWALSRNPDSYEAGLEIGERLKTGQPEQVILFSSIHYDFPEFFEALYSVLPKSSTRLFGGTADGVYSPEGVFDCGISAIGINSGGKIGWHPAISCGVPEAGDPAPAAADIDPTALPATRAKRSVTLAQAASGVPLVVGLLLADFQNDGVAVCEAAWQAAQCPLIGGLTGDDWKFERGYVFLDGEVYRDAVGFLGLSGDLAFDCHTASGWKAIGSYGMVQAASGNVVSRIDDLTAYAFVEREFGIPPADAELGVLTLMAFTDDSRMRYFLRTPSKIDLASGAMTLFGSIRPGTTVRVCNATRADVLEGIDAIAATLHQPGFVPKAAIVVSCGGRKWLLQKEISQEVSRLQAVFGPELPITGFSSFGEIGPYKLGNGQWSQPWFHNVSVVVFLIGERA